MTSVIIGCSVTLILAIVGATWKLSSIVTALGTSMDVLGKAVGKLSDVVGRHGEHIVEHDGRIERSEKDISRLIHKLDNANGNGHHQGD